MTALAQKTADQYAQMLAPLGHDVKLRLINSLSASLLSFEENHSARPLRKLGGYEGQIKIADDFDEIPDGFEEYI